MLHLETNKGQQIRRGGGKQYVTPTLFSKNRNYIISYNHIWSEIWDIIM